MQLTASFSLDLEKLNFYGSRDEIRKHDVLARFYNIN